MLNTIFAALAALGVYWVLMGGLIVLWALYTLVRLPFDLSTRGDD